nr:hypothetical protein [Tanacetum cinerariifolium]
MSDSEDFTVTYTEAPPSPDYVPGPEEPEQALSLPEFVPELVYPEFIEEQPLHAVDSPTTNSSGYIPESDPEEDPEEDDEDPKEDPADYLADKDADDDEEESSGDEADDEAKYKDEDEEDEEEEEHPAPADSIPPPPVHRVIARMSIKEQPPTPVCPTYPLRYRAVMIRQRAKTPSTSHPLSLSTPPSRTPPLLPIPLPTSSSPLLLPSTSHRVDVPEVTLPPRKRLRISLGPRYKVGESSSATAARPTKGYGITDTWDEMLVGMLGAPATDVTKLGRRMTNFATTVRQDTDEIYGRLDDAQNDRALISGRVNMLYRDIRDHARTARLMETEKMAPKRTARSTPATTTTTTTIMTDAQLKALIDQGVADALSARDADRSRNSKDNHDSEMGARRQALCSLELPHHLSRVHNTFHVPNLKKCLSDESLVISLDELRIDDTLHFLKEPVEIMDREIKQLKRRHIPIIKPKGRVRVMVFRVLRTLSNNAQGCGLVMNKYERGTEGVVGLSRWVEKIESVFHISSCAVENQVNFTTCTMLDAALTWWNGHVRTLGHYAAYAMTWEIFKKKLTEKYFPKGEIKKLEIELWNLKVKGNDVGGYTQRFQELTLMCTKFLFDETEKVEKYINGLLDNIHGNIMSERPKTLDFAIANDLMDQKLCTYAERQAENKRKFDNNNQDQQQLLKKQNVVQAYAVGSGEKKPYGGSKPLCPKCDYHHNGECAPKCTNCKKASHLTKDYWHPTNANNQRTITCYEYGNQGHYMSDFQVLKNQGTEARGMVYALEGRETNQDIDNTEDDINA